MSEPLNVLFVLADQWRADCLGAAGNPVIQTPNLDALSKEGTLFGQCFVQTAPCGPSRMCMYTSRYLCSHRTVNNKVPLVDAQENVGMALREAGYRPGLIGYNDYAVDPRTLPPDDPRTFSLSYDNVMPGFEEVLYHEYDSKAYFDYLREQGYPEALCNHDAIHRPNVPPEGPGNHLALRYPAYYKEADSECRFITNTAIDYVQKRRDEGWFLSLNYIKPHPPRICPAPYNDLYNPADMPDPARNFEELKSDHPYLSRIYGSPELVAERDLRETQANYYGMITEVDTSLGLLFQALKETGQWDRTMVLFSSDHGEYLGDHYLTGKGRFYDGAMHVPLIVRDPSPGADATRGQCLDGFVESIDHAPTMLAFLGVPIPDRFQGQSVLGRVRGEAGGKDAIFYEKDIRTEVEDFVDDLDLGLVWVVRDEDFKYIHFADERMPPLLFDLKADPGEGRNLADDPGYAGTVLCYCQRLLRWRMKYEDQRMVHWAARHR